MLNNESPILFADFYKPSHISMYSRDTEYVQDNMTPRNVKYFPHFADGDERILFGGLQGFLKWFLIEMFNKNFFELSKEEALSQYKEIMDISIGKDAVEMSGWEKLHHLGYLPLEIRALPEGTLSPVQVPVFTIQNTHPDFYWLPNYLETVISAETWKTITSATTAFQFKKLCLAAAERTGCGTDHVPFQAHEFAYRGQSGSHDAAQSGVGHLFSFSGTDTIPAIVYANRYYNMKGKFVAGSIPASEHSVATTNIGSTVAEFDKHESWSTISLDSKRYLAEQDFLKKYITELFPTGFVSYVADSYDFWAVITQMSVYLKKEIMARDGSLVFRPDSGIPEHIIAGYSWDGVDYSSWNMMDGGEQICNYEAVKVNGKFYKIVDCSYIDSYNEIPDHEIKGAVECLWEIFGGTVTDKGFKVLDPHVGLIYGDSITISRAKDIFQRLEEKGFASSNVVFGVGSYTTQYVTRDSLGFAVKATGAVIAGEQIMVVKEPKTDMGKKSAKGFLKVVRDDKGDLKLVDNLSIDEVQSEDNELRTVFKDGKLIVDEDLDTIRQRVNSQI